MRIVEQFAIIVLEKSSPVVFVVYQAKMQTSYWHANNKTLGDGQNL